MAHAWETLALAGMEQYSSIRVTKESYQAVIARLPTTEWK
jgi:hypothetical protein